MAPQVQQPHVIVFPFPMQGHINGMLELANYLISQHLQVTFVHSARNYSCLIHSKPGDTDLPMRVEVLADGLPTDPKQPFTSEEYFASARRLEKELEHLLEKLKNEGNPVLCLVSDTFLPGTQAVADKFGIPRVDFWTSSATAYSMCSNLAQVVSKGILPLPDSDDIGKYLEETMIDFIPGLPPFPLAELPKESLVKDYSDVWLQFYLRSFSCVRDAERILVNTFYEIESRVFDALQMDGIPIYPVGPLFASGMIGSDHKTAGGALANLLPEDNECMEWLDRHTVSSVLYVSFGSYFSLCADEIRELVRGLGACQLPFILVIRPDTFPGTLSDIFPDGYLSTLADRGRIISWAPQRALLAHPSVGGFLTHCGWNSTLESLWMGVPLIGCPRGAEQRSNLRYIAQDWKVGIALETQPGGGGGGGFSREAVETAVRCLMQGEEGREARQRCLELKEKARKAMAEGGVSRGYLDEFVKDMIEKNQAIAANSS